jgi:alanyl-tRNA synthetase
MESQLLYQQDPTKLEFDASVVEILSLPGGRTGVILDQTYFYPTGGGQEHDNGLIGTAEVMDVYKDEQKNCLVHVIEGEVSTGAVHSAIDAERRLRHMQHHSAQHLLTQCIFRQAGYETVSANINGYSPSTLDLLAPQISKADLDLAEQMANRIIYEDRPVKTYFVAPEDLTSIPLRRPPKVSENIRIVEIDGFDYSPCGGTHVLHTGSIGLVKVLKAEKQNDKQRVYFIAGWQAMELFDDMYDNITTLANQLSIAWQDIPSLVDKQTDQLTSLQRELQSLRLSSVKYEARELMEGAEEREGVRLIRYGYQNRSIDELRLLAEELKRTPNVVACLATYDGQKVSLVVTCGESTGKDARQLLNNLLASINGRGGGAASQAQGGGVATPQQFSSLLRLIKLE